MTLDTRHQRPETGGFTLIETVIVIALSTCMMLALSFVIFHFNETISYEQAVAQSSGSASALVRELTSLILPANAVLQTHTFSTSTHTSSSTALVLEIPSIDSMGNVIANTYDYAAFYVVETDAYRLLEANALSARTSGTRLLGSAVNTLTFTYTDADFSLVNTVTFDVQTLSVVKQHTLSDHRRAQVRLRNH